MEGIFNQNSLKFIKIKTIIKINQIKYSMKRKSEEIVPNINRILRKNKTQGFQKKQKRIIDQSTHKWSQLMVEHIVEQLLQNVHKRIKIVAHEQLINNVVECCQIMSLNLSQLICPQLHEIQCQVHVDEQPKRVPFDPICGFDKLITIRQDSNSRNEENSALETKSKQFSVFQNYKKMQSQKNTLSSISSVSKLIPLQSLDMKLNQTISQKQNQKQQLFYRDRLLETNLPFINNTQSRKSEPKKNNTKVGIDLLKPSPSDNYVFDYNGQKSCLASNNFAKIANNSMAKQPNNVLKTTYKVLQRISQDKKKGSLSKNKDRKPKSGNGNLSQSQITGKQIIKNPNLRYQGNGQINQSLIIKPGFSLDQQQIIKSLLETSFRQRQMVIRPIEKTHRNQRLV